MDVNTDYLVIISVHAWMGITPRKGPDLEHQHVSEESLWSNLTSLAFRKPELVALVGCCHCVLKERTVPLLNTLGGGLSPSAPPHRQYLVCSDLGQVAVSAHLVLTFCHLWLIFAVPSQPDVSSGIFRKNKRFDWLPCVTRWRRLTKLICDREPRAEAAAWSSSLLLVKVQRTSAKTESGGLFCYCKIYQ